MRTEVALNGPADTHEGEFHNNYITERSKYNEPYQQNLWIPRAYKSYQMKEKLNP